MTNNGKTDKLVGKAKETAGDVTDNEELKGEGVLKQVEGKITEVGSDIKDKTEEVIGDVKEKFDNK
ncbi:MULTISPECIES: CsbD family protein [unclassified Vagococcus]|uniref:CsbD family protein n=1 Tax=unclassified Vagococcus TaxID=2648499 RepID=UPI001F5113B6|nr:MULTISPECIES: CsbD family protein [unclassified Vagococcus]MCI0130986.1 CsbD family protein [Vagococcus sp. CY53-2]UNM89438.1 CsbD family protein [Vagococcus sp. CY52-2]